MIKNNFNYRTEATFRPEFEFFNRNFPHCLNNQCKVRFEDNLPDGFISIIGGNRQIENTLMPTLSDLDIREVDGWEIFGKDPTKTVEILNNLLEHQGYDTSDWTHEVSALLIHKFGRDAFGLYLPFHFYHDCNWGIYLFPEIIKSHCDWLHTEFKSKISLKNLRAFYMLAVYRHELFHYETERFATKLELATHHPHYINLGEINKQVAFTKDWLEEALAESAVLSSRLIKNRTKIDSKLFRKIYEYDLRFMPPGYADYACTSYGGPYRAHTYFAGQIIEMMRHPTIEPTDMLTIKNEFSSDDYAVPLYLVTGFNNIRRMR